MRGETVEHLNKVPEVAEKLGLSEKTVWAWVGARRIAVHRVGRSVRIADREMSAFFRRDTRLPWSNASERHSLSRALCGDVNRARRGDVCAHRRPARSVGGGAR